MAYADDVNILGVNIHNLKENAEALVAATREIGLEVSADNSTFERVEDYKYLGTTLTNQNSIAEEIKSRLRSGNAIIRCRIFCLPGCCPGNYRLRYIER